MSTDENSTEALPEPESSGTSRGLRGRRTEILVAVAMGIVVTVLSLAQLFAGEDIGLQDNGDGWRVWCHMGRTVHGLEEFTFTSEAGSAPNCPYRPAYSQWAFASSMDPIIRVAIDVDAVITGSSDETDIRTLGVLGSLAYGVIAAAAVLVFPGPLPARAAVIGLAMILWLDIGFHSYLNSYYSEAAAFVGGAALVVALAAHFRWPGIISVIAVVLTALVASMAKPQTLVILAPLVVVLIAAPLLKGGGKRGVVTSVVGSGVLFVAALLYMQSYGAVYAEINAYDTLFTAALVESDDPSGDLETLGLPQSFLPYVGTGYWPYEDAARTIPDYPIFVEKAGRAWTTTFVVTHPRIMFSMIKKSIDFVDEFRPLYLGNYELRTGVADRPEPVTWILRKLRPASLWLPLLWFGAIIGGAVAAWRWRRSESVRTWALIAVFTGGSAALSAIAVPFGAGYFELGKHLVFAAWWTAPLFAGAAVLAVVGIVRLVKDRLAGHA